MRFIEDLTRFKDRPPSEPERQITVAPAEPMADLVLMLCEGLHKKMPGYPIQGTFYGSAEELAVFFARVMESKLNLLYMGYCYHTILWSVACSECNQVTHVQLRNYQSETYWCTACQHEFPIPDLPSEASEVTNDGLASSAKQRFVTKTQPDGDCLRWTGALDSTGYGAFKVSGHKVNAHRWAYENLLGKPAGDLDVTQTCGNRWCVKLAHLTTRTRSETRRAVDEEVRGRFRPAEPAALGPATSPEGGGCGHSTATDKGCPTCNLRQLALAMQRRGVR